LRGQGTARGGFVISAAVRSKAIAVIPARFASTRFPGKLLHPLYGKSVLARVIERAREIPGLDALLVATDDDRIAAEARRAGAEVRLTSPEHASGSDRIGEVVAGMRPAPDLVLNLQGDEPLFSPAAVGRLLASARNQPDAIWTLAEPILDEEEFARPSAVKVVTAPDGRALYFSRAPIPHFRTSGALLPAAGRGDAPETAAVQALRHVGVYVYPRPLLEAFLSAPPGRLERAEALEQLRALEAGLTIRVSIGAWPDAGIDTPEDLERVLRRYPDEAALDRAGRLGS